MVNVDTFLSHYGTKGMKWGVRKDQHREYRDKDTRDTTNMVKRAGSTAQMGRYFAQGTVLKKQQNYTEDWYDKLEGGKEYLEKGTTLNRVVRGVDDRTLDGRLYVSSLASDNEMYKAVIPVLQTKWGLGQKQYHTAYQIELETKKKLAMPSQKERVDVFIETIQTPEGRKWMSENGYKSEITELNAKQLGISAYKKFNTTAGAQGVKINDVYFNKVKSRGYGAIADDNDAGVWSKKPAILLSPKGDVKMKSVRQLTADEINQAQRDVIRNRDFGDRKDET